MFLVLIYFACLYWNIALVFALGYFLYALNRSIVWVYKGNTALCPSLVLVSYTCGIRACVACDRRVF